MKALVNKIKDLFFPPRCALCDDVLDIKEKNVCEKCEKNIGYIKGPICYKCGRPVKEGEEYCFDCKKENHVFNAGRFPLSYEYIGDSLFRFKYNNRPEYADFYAKCSVKRYGEWIEGLKAQALVPVPLNKKRFAKRGYNQAEEYCKALSLLTGIPMYADIVKRVRDTKPQKIFDKKGRRQNVKKAFNVTENVVKLNTIILVDDIFTTGSTIDALSEEFRNKGVKNIYFITVSGAGT